MYDSTVRDRVFQGGLPITRSTLPNKPSSESGMLFLNLLVHDPILNALCLLKFCFKHICNLFAVSEIFGFLDHSKLILPVDEIGLVQLSVLLQLHAMIISPRN